MLSFISVMLRSPVVWGRPTTLFIETSNYCNLKCPVCRTGSNNLVRPKGNMSFENFKIIIDQVKNYTNTTALYFMGEPFLNPDIYKIISYAKKAGIFTTLCTNGELLEPNKVLTSGLDEIWFQVSGLTKESHTNYRVGSNFDKMMENLTGLNTLREELNGKLRIVVGFIVMKHNEHQLKDFDELCKKLKVDEGVKITPRVYSLDHAGEFLPKKRKFNRYELEEFRDKKVLALLRRFRNDCKWLWFCTEITWNGDVLPCCEDEEANFVMGNIFKEDLASIWNNDKYKEFRKKILKKQKDVFICSRCLGMSLPLLN